MIMDDNKSELYYVRDWLWPDHLVTTILCTLHYVPTGLSILGDGKCKRLNIDFISGRHVHANWHLGHIPILRAVIKDQRFNVLLRRTVHGDHGRVRVHDNWFHSAAVRRVPVVSVSHSPQLVHANNIFVSPDRPSHWPVSE